MWIEGFKNMKNVMIYNKEAKKQEIKEEKEMELLREKEKKLPSGYKILSEEEVNFLRFYFNMKMELMKE